MTSRSNTTFEFRVSAQPEIVMTALRDLDRLPEWSTMHRNVEIVARDAMGRPQQIRVDAKVAFLTDKEVLRYEWENDRMSWTLEQSAYLRAQNGAFDLTPDPAGTRIVFSISIEAKFQAPSFVVRTLEQATSASVSKRFAAFAEAYRP